MTKKEVDRTRDRIQQTRLNFENAEKKVRFWEGERDRLTVGRGAPAFDQAAFDEVAEALLRHRTLFLHYGHMLDQNRWFAERFSLNAIVLLTGRRIEDAKLSFEMAIALDPDHVDAKSALEIIAVGKAPSGPIEMADKIFITGLLFLLGYSEKEAESSFRHTLALAPGHSGATRMLEKLGGKQ